MVICGGGGDSGGGGSNNNSGPPLGYREHNQNADEAYIGVSVGVSLQSTDKFFRHFGFAHVGGNYKLRL